MAQQDGGQKIKTAYRLVRILELLREAGPLTTTEVSNRLDIAKSTAHAYLSSMHDLELIVLDDGGYAPSLKLLDHGMARRERLRIVEVAKPSLDQLAEDTEEAVHLTVEEHGMGVYVDYVLGDRAVKSERALPRIGTRSPLHCLSSGKAILANLPEERVAEILDERGLPEETEHTISSESELYEELERVREQGYAINRHEANRGVHSVGAPVVVEGSVLGAISIAGPANRLTIPYIESEVVDELLASTNEIELMLTHQSPG